MTNKQKESTIKKDILNKWIDYYFKLENQIISANHITSAISSFESLILSNLSTIDQQGKAKRADGVSDSTLELEKFSESSFHSPSSLSSFGLKLLILFKVKTVNNQYRTISPLQIIDIGDISELNQLFIEYWNIKSEDYYLASYSDLIFTFKILETNMSKKIIKPGNDKSVVIGVESKTRSLRFGGYSLPASMDFTVWGDYHFTGDNSAIVYKRSSPLEYHIQLFENYQLVELRLGDKIVLSFKDEMHPKSDLSSFTRTVKNHVYIFKEGELILKQIEKNVSFLTKERKNYFNAKNFLTMDLETRIINNEMSSYCVSNYDGKIKKSFYLNDYSNEKEMLRASVIYLMKRKYNNHKIYLHNFSGFDAVFLLRVMTDLSNKVRPILRDGRYIDIRLDFAEKYKIYFRDSLLLVPVSLRNLAINFNVENKGIFPYKFVNNKDIPLDYVGEVPDYKYFEGITAEEYREYCKEFINKPWDLKIETIKYCELDCLVLYQIIEKFSDNIFKLFRIDILKYPTLASLAFAIYRSNFLNESKIPLIHGEIYDFIKQAYTGGSVDVYKPTPVSSSTVGTLDFNSKVYRYDVNSLYPYVMKNFPMPVEKPIYFEGDILKTISSLYPIEIEKPFGVFEVEIEAPSNLKIPILQKRIKLNKGYRTISPTGNWSGYYFSDELYNAAKYGYKFKVLRGYLFKKGNIFTEYVDYLYNLKKNSVKGTSDYIISKLLLNSLYGRLGMSPVNEQHIILSNEEAVKFYSKVNVNNILDLKNGKEMISFFILPSDFPSGDDKNFDIKNISVVVSAIVTASARMYMSQFKTDKNITTYYTDTDSIDIDKELDPKYIGEDLGQFKLEHVFEEAIFLAPKVYGGKNKNYEYVRIKGLKNPIYFEELKQLLHKDSKLEIKQEKWYSDVANGKFHINDEIYTLMVTDSKRKLIYNDDNIFYDTLPLTLKNGEII